MFTRATADWTWAGKPAGEATTRFNFVGALSTSEAAGALTKISTFFAALVPYLPAAVTVATRQTLEIFDETKAPQGGYAELASLVQATSNAGANTGTATGVWSAATGCWINWTTAATVNGRKVAGRTFLVPLGNTPVFQTDGTLNDTFRTALVNAGNALNTSTPTHCIFFNRGGPSDPPKPSDKPHVSGINAAIGCNVPDKAGVLRSRRD